MRMRSGVLLIGLGGVVAIVCIVFVLLAITSNEVRERYSSYSDAVDRDAEAHGMVPPFLPNSAVGIVAERDLDADTLIVEFTYGDDFDVNSVGLKKSSASLPDETLESTSLGKVDVDRLEVFSNIGSDRTCASHLVVEEAKRKAAYIYNIAPHRAGCVTD